MSKRYIEKIKVSMIFLKHIWKESKLYFLLKIFNIILGVFTNVFNAISLKYFIDAITIHKSLEVFLRYIVIYLIIAGFIIITSNITIIIERDIYHKINIMTTKDTICKIYKIPYDVFDEHKNYDIINRAFAYATNSGTEFVDAISDFLEKFFTMISFLYILVSHSFVIIIVIIICAIIQVLLSKKQKKIYYKYDRDITPVNRKIEHFKGLALNKMLAKEIKTNMENFFSILKQEIYYGNVFYSFNELKLKIQKFINYYNNNRTKEKLIEVTTRKIDYLLI